MLTGICHFMLLCRWEAHKFLSHRGSVAVLLVYLTMLVGAGMNGVRDVQERMARQALLMADTMEDIRHHRERSQALMDGTLTTAQARFSDSGSPYMVGAWLVRPQ